MDAVPSLECFLVAVLEWRVVSRLKLCAPAGVLDASLSFEGATPFAQDEVCSLCVLLEPTLSMTTQIAPVVWSTYSISDRLQLQLHPYSDTGSPTTVGPCTGSLRIRLL